MILSPLVGLHQNVAVLDYTDEYVNIIVNDNISYETVTSTTKHNNRRLGILPKIVKQVFGTARLF